jgi:multisubunit Na+/H+ antiporter MnhG subunit
MVKRGTMNYWYQGAAFAKAIISYSICFCLDPVTIHMLTVAAFKDETEQRERTQKLERRLGVRCTGS